MKHTRYLFGLICATALFAGCGEEQVTQEPVIRPVRYQQVFSTGGSRDRSFSGIASAGEESNLSFKVSGTITQIAVKVGDAVRAGQLIARLDDKDYKLNMQQVEAQFNQAEAQVRKAEADYDRVRSLYENRNAARSDLDAARAARESAAASVRALQNQLELTRLQVQYTQLRSSVNGSIASVEADVNENVQAGKTIVMMTSGERPEVEVAIPEVLIGQIKSGTPVTVSFDATQDRAFAATITEVGVAATGVGTMFPVTVRLNRADEAVRPGMAAVVQFRFEEGDDRMVCLIPPVAAAEDRQGRYVYTLELEEDGFAITRRRPVTVGELTEKGLEISDGLVDGDLVVTAGVSRIQDGMKVRISLDQEGRQ